MVLLVADYYLDLCHGCNFATTFQSANVGKALYFVA